MYKLLLKKYIVTFLLLIITVLVITVLVLGLLNCEKSGPTESSLTDIDLYVLDSSKTGGDSLRYINEEINVVIDVYFPEYLDSIAHFCSIDNLVYGISKNNITEKNTVTYTFSRPCTAMVYARGFSGGTLITSDSIAISTVEKHGTNQAPQIKLTPVRYYAGTAIPCSIFVSYSNPEPWQTITLSVDSLDSGYTIVGDSLVIITPDSTDSSDYLNIRIRATDNSRSPLFSEDSVSLRLLQVGDVAPAPNNFILAEKGIDYVLLRWKGDSITDRYRIYSSKDRAETSWDSIEVHDTLLIDSVQENYYYYVTSLNYFGKSKPGSIIFSCDTLHFGHRIFFTDSVSTISEGDSIFTLMVSVSDVAKKDITVWYSIDYLPGNASIQDILPIDSALTLLIPKDSLKGSINFNLIDDNVNEGKESFVIRLDSCSSGFLDGIISFTGTIVDNDTIVVPPNPPEIISAPKSPTNDSSLVFKWTSSDNTKDFQYRYKKEDTTWTTTNSTMCTIKMSKDDTCFFEVKARDTALNVSKSATKIVVVDFTGPKPPIVTGPKSPSNNVNTIFSWVSGGSGNSFFQYRVDSISISNLIDAGSNLSCTLSLAEGPHILYVREQDSAGNWSDYGTATVMIDITPPRSPKVVGPSAITIDRTPTLTWQSGGPDGEGIYRIRCNTLAWDTLKTTSFTQDPALGHGQYKYEVQERDTAGNWSENGVCSVFVDINPPLKPIPLSVDTFNTTVCTLSWKSGGQGLGVFRYGIDKEAVDSTDTTTLIISRNRGEHTFWIIERDVVGNWSDTAFDTFTVYFDPPMLISPANNAVLDNGRADGLDTLVWDFDWEDKEGATKYELHVWNGNDTSIKAVILPEMELQSQYHHVTTVPVAAGNCQGWNWRVRAMIEDSYTLWSVVRKFDVEQPNLDSTMTEYWVDAANGDNRNSGLRNAPWRTITHAIAKAPDGQVGRRVSLHILPGTYDKAHGETFPIQPKYYQGLIGDPVNRGTGRDSTIIRGSGNSSYDKGLCTIMDSGGAVISGLVISKESGVDHIGVFISSWGDCSEAFISRNTFIGLSRGIEISSCGNIKFDTIVDNVFIENKIGIWTSHDRGPVILDNQFINTSTGDPDSVWAIDCRTAGEVILGNNFRTFNGIRLHSVENGYNPDLYFIDLGTDTLDGNNDFSLVTRTALLVEGEGILKAIGNIWPSEPPKCDSHIKLVIRYSLTVQYGKGENNTCYYDE